ncbi:MAG: hypothetical protein AAF170_00885 [Bacteroidota bacterium]
MVRISSALLVLLVLACSLPAFAQGTPPKRVVLVDGTVIIGNVIDANTDPVVVIGSNGVEQRVPQARIAEITDLLQGRFTRYDPARTRLFFSPTARSLGSGVKRFSAYYIFPSFAVGINDSVDLSAGATIPFISSEGTFIGINGNAKATLVQTEDVAIALGTSASVPLSSEGGDTGVVGTVYGLATLGNEAGAVTLGAYGLYISGFGVDSELADGTALLIGLEKQISDRFKLVSENYVFVALGDGGTDTAYGSLTGVRFFGDRLAADIAVAFGAADGSFSTIPIPYLGLSYTF